MKVGDLVEVGVYDYMGDLSLTPKGKRIDNIIVPVISIKNDLVLVQTPYTQHKLASTLGHEVLLCMEDYKQVSFSRNKITSIYVWSHSNGGYIAYYKDDLAFGVNELYIADVEEIESDYLLIRAPEGCIDAGILWEVYDGYYSVHKPCPTPIETISSSKIIQPTNWQAWRDRMLKDKIEEEERRPKDGPFEFL